MGDWNAGERRDAGSRGSAGRGSAGRGSAGRGGDAAPGGGHQDSPVRRRKVLLAFGGLLVTGTATACAPAASRGQGPAAGAPVPGSPGGKSPGRPGAARGHPRTASHVEHARTAGHDGTGGQGGAAHPGEPVYYIDDGPMTVALTIDDGPSPVYTPQVLRVLERYGIRATFSMIGRNVASYPAIAREVAGAGHGIANHTWSHPNLAVMAPAAMREEVTRAATEIHAATGRGPGLFRAPYGSWSPALLEFCAAQKLTPLDWSVDPRDWARPGVTAIVANILRTTRTGSIILEHDGGGDRSQTVEALKIVLPRLLDEGFRFREA